MTEVNYEIWQAGFWLTVKPTDAVNTTRRVQSFCVSNSLNNTLVKSQGGWYKIELDGRMSFVIRALYLLSFEDLYNILKKK